MKVPGLSVSGLFTMIRGTLLMHMLHGGGRSSDASRIDEACNALSKQVRLALFMRMKPVDLSGFGVLLQGVDDDHN